MNTPSPADLPCPTLPRLAPRSLESHKGSFGTALLIGGSRGMAGAIAMAGMAAARCGAGRVKLAVPSSSLDVVAGFSPCYMTIPLPTDSAGTIATTVDELAPHLDSASCVAIGPGLGCSSKLQQLTIEILKATECPVVADADALNHVAAEPNWQDLLRPPMVLTPHPGEWQRLCGIEAADRQMQVAAAVQCAKRRSVTIVLKGHRSAITDGQTLAWNETGTPAMATGGSGDVLTGIITALICQGLSVQPAAQLAAHVHGLAGEIAASQLCSHVVLPTELIDFLPRAFDAAN